MAVKNKVGLKDFLEVFDLFEEDTRKILLMIGKFAHRVSVTIISLVLILSVVLLFVPYINLILM